MSMASLAITVSFYCSALAPLTTQHAERGRQHLPTRPTEEYRLLLVVFGIFLVFSLDIGVVS